QVESQPDTLSDGENLVQRNVRTVVDRSLQDTIGVRPPARSRPGGVRREYLPAVTQGDGHIVVPEVRGAGSVVDRSEVRSVAGRKTLNTVCRVYLRRREVSVEPHVRRMTHAAAAVRHRNRALIPLNRTGGAPVG